ncbi:UNVERIFIED_CONTAM: hypothetical protein K2H54_033165 [Gekko kuhli]
MPYVASANDPNVACLPKLVMSGNTCILRKLCPAAQNPQQLQRVVCPMGPFKKFFAPDRKGEDKLLPSDLSVQEVATEVLESPKPHIEEEVENGAILPMIPSQIVDLVQPGSTSFQSLPAPVGVAGSLAHKSMSWRRCLALGKALGTKETFRSKAGTHLGICYLIDACQTLMRGDFPTSLVASQELLPSSEEAVTTVLEHLGFVLVAGMTSEMSLSAQLLCLLRGSFMVSLWGLAERLCQG